MSYRKERFRLRFRGLSEEMQKDILAALPGIEAKQRGSVLVFEMQEAIELAPLYTTLDALRIGTEQFEVIASLVTASDNGGIDLPKYILQFIRRTQCGCGFSFVSVGLDDDEDESGRIGQPGNRGYDRQIWDLPTEPRLPIGRSALARYCAIRKRRTTRLRASYYS
jgi:hypothetical protein